MTKEEYYKMIKIRLKINKETPKDLSKFPDFPKRLEDMSDQKFYDNIMNYWEEKSSLNRKKVQEENEIKNPADKLNTDLFYDFRFPKNFNDEEEKKIVEDCIINKIYFKDLIKKYDTTMEHIKDILRKAGFSIVPKNWDETNLPEKSEDVSQEEYYKTLQWLIKIKMKMPKDLSEYPDFPEKSQDMS